MKTEAGKDIAALRSSSQAHRGLEHSTALPQLWDQEQQAQGIVSFLNNYEIYTNYLTLLELTALTDKYSHFLQGLLGALSNRIQYTA